MTNNKKDLNAPFQHENHTLKTRRDFLSQGLLAGLSYTMIPSLLSMIHSNAANALECGLGQQTAVNRVPVLIFDLSGGANFVGSNVMVGKAGGQLDFIANYESIGLPTEMHPKNAGQTNNELGLVFHNDSAILRGIKSSTSAATRAKIEGGIFCFVANDDTKNNPLNPMYWLNKAGANGNLVQLAGTSNSDSGGHSTAPQSSLVSSLKPVVLNTPKDALELVNIGRLGSLYGSDKAQRVLKTIENLSSQKLKMFNSKALPDQIKDLVNCGYIRSQDLLSRFTVTEVDPAQDLIVRSIFTKVDTDVHEKKTATMAKLILDGYVGVGTIERSGFDYHVKNRSTGEIKDFDAGDMIGKVMELAAAKGKDILIYVYTDGGVSSKGPSDDSIEGRGKLPWISDSGTRSGSFMLLYRNAGKPSLRVPNKRQIGFYKDNGAADSQATMVSNSVTNLTKAVVANYLSLTGDESKLAEVVGDNPFGSSLKDYLFFNKIK